MSEPSTPKTDSRTLSEKFGEPDWYEEYSPHHELPYSSLASFVFHFCLMMMLPLLAMIVVPPDTTPPPVEVVTVAEATSDMGEAGDDLPSGEGLTGQEETFPQEPLPVDTPSEVLDTKLDPIEASESLDTTQDLQDQILQDQGRVAAAAQAAAAAVRQRLNENLGGGSGGSSGTGGGGGRAGRAARWVLKFNSSNSQDYLQQLGGLGAELGFPQRGDSWIYFSNLSASPTRSVRNLSGENRMYWMDDNRSAVQRVAGALGVNPPPDMMIAFLPIPLEEKMLKLELAFKGARSEADVVQTVFEAVRHGGGYDVIVVKQQLRGE